MKSHKRLAGARHRYYVSGTVSYTLELREHLSVHIESQTPQEAQRVFQAALEEGELDDQLTMMGSSKTWVKRPWITPEKIKIIQVP